MNTMMLWIALNALDLLFTGLSISEGAAAGSLLMNSLKITGVAGVALYKILVVAFVSFVAFKFQKYGIISTQRLFKLGSCAMLLICVGDLMLLQAVLAAH